MTVCKRCLLIDHGNICILKQGSKIGIHMIVVPGSTFVFAGIQKTGLYQVITNCDQGGCGNFRGCLCFLLFLFFLGLCFLLGLLSRLADHIIVYLVEYEK